jgi:hypothetical protein
VNTDGPVVYGCSGGALGTTGGGNKLALEWRADQSVSLRGPLTLNDKELRLRGDPYHGVGWYGSGKFFTGSVNTDGPVVYGCSGGALGTTGGGNKLALEWTAGQVVSLSAPLRPDDWAHEARNARPLSSDQAKLLLYKYADNNWAGLGVHTGGDIWIRTGTSAQHVLQLAEDGSLSLSGGARCNGRDWLSGCSREYKTDIKPLSAETATEAFRDLTPVIFSYRDDDGARHLGFIAEDVPEAIAQKGRRTLSPISIVALLTKVVQQHESDIEELRNRG